MVIGEVFVLTLLKMIVLIYLARVWAVLGLHRCPGFSLIVVGMGYSRCGAQASRCGGCSWSRAQALRHMRVSRRSSWSSGSLVMTQELSCSSACGSFQD